MHTVPIDIDRHKARSLYREYRKHVHWSTPIDRECQRAYQFLALGRLVIQALESVKAAGVNTEGEGVGFPKLALCRADAVSCACSLTFRGGCTMTPDDTRPRFRWRADNALINWRNVMSWPDGTFALNPSVRRTRAVALVPTPPLHLRPKRGLANYHILWEAEWTKRPPNDPLLLRRIGQGDLWLVVAQWDLTPVERAALSTRVRA
jgi:hypothetical protein